MLETKASEEQKMEEKSGGHLDAAANSAQTKGAPRALVFTASVRSLNFSIPFLSLCLRVEDVKMRVWSSRRRVEQTYNDILPMKSSQDGRVQNKAFQDNRDVYR